uniref:ubiquitinyl hydrolase 1 n=1 Tax=Culicoides sonorensis TaxID=179676 RepID=A0A336K4T9_CULSO
MPVISTRYSTTTTGNSYISPSVGTFRSTFSATSRSSADRSSSIERPSYTNTTESFLNRSRGANNTYRLTSSASYRLSNSTNDSFSSRYGTQPHRSSSLARSVAISGLELYEKYSPANYTPKSELTRSSSLTENSSSPHIPVNNNKESSPVVGHRKEHLLKHGSSTSMKNKTQPIDFHKKSQLESKNTSKIRHALQIKTSSCSGTSRNQTKNNITDNNNSIMPSFTPSTCYSEINKADEFKSKNKLCTNLILSNKSHKPVSNITSIFNGNPNKKASFLPVNDKSSSSHHTGFQNENFLKKEYELARTQVIQKNLSKQNEQDNTNNNMSENIKNNFKSEKYTTDDKQELNEIRNKILGKNSDNMMSRGKVLSNTSTNSGESNDDIKFIDSDSDNLSDKKISPVNEASLNIIATPNHITKMLATSTPIKSNEITRNTNNTLTLNKTNTYPPKPSETNASQIFTQNSVISPNNKKLILNASPKNSCVYEKQQQEQYLLQNISITNSEPDDLTNTCKRETKMDSIATVALTAGTAKIRIISNDTEDDNDFSNVSTSATIILPSRVKQNGSHVIVKKPDGEQINNTTNKDASSILLEKKNTLNHKQLSENNDCARNASSIRSALPPTSSLSSRTNWEKDSYKSYSSRNYDNGSSSNSSYILPRSTKTGSPAREFESRKVEKETVEGLCGLWNIGNTCFMNSVLQCLSNTKELTKGIKALVPVRSSGKDQRIFTEFQRLIKELWSPGNRSVNPSEFKMAFSSKHRMYSGSAQQDSQEFLRFFLDSVHGALNTATKAEPITLDDNMSDSRKAELMWNWYSKTENSVIKDLFVGQLKSTLKCTECGNTSTTFDPFWDLSLPLPSNTRCKLSDCLDLFIKEEILDGDEMPTCSKCKTRRKSTKNFTIQRYPKILVIHLKRFSETRWSKLTTLVEFPTSEGGLNLAPFASSSNTETNNGLYSLYATSNHMGSTAGGHYVAFCKHPTTKKWHEFNDNSVTDTPESSLVSSSAYLLFYERV